MQKGDILLLLDGSLVQFQGTTGWAADIPIIQYMDREESSFGINLDHAENLGQTPAVLASFYTGRSIHLRLNKLAFI